MARRNFAVVLAEMIEDGSTSQSTAMDVARACFHDNPATVYGVDARKAGAENGR